MFKLIHIINYSIRIIIFVFTMMLVIDYVYVLTRGKMGKAVEIGENVGLAYVYQGNVSEGENTYCPNCGKLLIERKRFNMFINEMKNAHTAERS